MVLLMVIAAVYAVLQLALVTSLSRSVRVTTLLLAVGTGYFCSGFLAVVAEYVYTRSVVASTGRPLIDVVVRAASTVDPMIEELAKVLPLLLITAFGRRFRRLWGLTDAVALGGCVGGGFALLEATLRYAGRSGQLVPDAVGGYVVLTGFDSPRILGVPALLGQWLPAPTASLGLVIGTDANLHLYWSALAGLGVALLWRCRGLRKVLALLPLGYACLDHAAYNATSVTVRPSGLAGVPDAIRPALAVLVTVMIIAAVLVDRLQLNRPGQAVEAVSTRTLVGFAVTAPPFTAAVAWRFVLARRALIYSSTSTPDDRLTDLLDEIGERLEPRPDRRSWYTAARQRFGLLSPRAWLGWRSVLWLVLITPALLYLVLGATRATSVIQAVMARGVPFWIVIGLAALGVAYGAWQLLVLLRTLPSRARRPWSEDLLRGLLRTAAGTGALLGSVLAVVRAFRAGAGSGPMVSNLHLLDAVGRSLLIAAVVLLLLGLLLLFPPGGGLVLAGVGAVAAGTTVTAAEALGAAALVGSLGWAMIKGREYLDHGDDLPAREPMNSRRRGNTPGPNGVQNKQAVDAVQEAERQLGRKLRREESDRIHEEISKQGLGYWEVVQTIVDLSAEERRTMEWDGVPTEWSAMLGLPAWGVSVGYAGHLRINFGAPREEDRGEWRLWIEWAGWRIRSADRILVGSEDADGRPSVEVLEGAVITDLRVDPATMDATVQFGTDLAVDVFARNGDRRTYQWSLFLPDGRYFGAEVGPTWVLESAMADHPLGYLAPLRPPEEVPHRVVRELGQDADLDEMIAELVGRTVRVAEAEEFSDVRLHLDQGAVWINTYYRIEAADGTLLVFPDRRGEESPAVIAGLVGQRIVAIWAEDVSFDLVVSFDGGLVLRSFTIVTAEHPSWQIEFDDRRVVWAGPGSAWRRGRLVDSAPPPTTGGD